MGVDTNGLRCVLEGDACARRPTTFHPRPGSRPRTGRAVATGRLSAHVTRMKMRVRGSTRQAPEGYRRLPMEGVPPQVAVPDRCRSTTSVRRTPPPEHWNWTVGMALPTRWDTKQRLAAGWGGVLGWGEWMWGPVCSSCAHGPHSAGPPPRAHGAGASERSGALQQLRTQEPPTRRSAQVTASPRTCAAYLRCDSVDQSAPPALRLQRLNNLPVGCAATTWREAVG